MSYIEKRKHRWTDCAGICQSFGVSYFSVTPTPKAGVKDERLYKSIRKFLTKQSYAFRESLCDLADNLVYYVKGCR